MACAFSYVNLGSKGNCWSQLLTSSGLFFENRPKAAAQSGLQILGACLTSFSFFFSKFRGSEGEERGELERHCKESVKCWALWGEVGIRGYLFSCFTTEEVSDTVILLPLSDWIVISVQFLSVCKSANYLGEHWFCPVLNDFRSVVCHHRHVCRESNHM